MYNNSRKAIDQNYRKLIKLAPKRNNCAVSATISINKKTGAFIGNSNDGILIYLSRKCRSKRIDGYSLKTVDLNPLTKFNLEKS